MIEALRAAVDEVLLALAPLTQAAGDSEKMLWLLSELGWTPDSVPQPLTDLATAGSDLIGLVGADPDATSTPEIFAAVGKLVAAIDEIRTKPDSAFPSGLDVASFKATIGPDLLDYLLVEHLLSYHYGIAGPLLLAGFIRLVPQPASGLRRQYLRRQVMWSAAGETFEDPVRGFRDAFDWNSSAPRLTAALGALGSLLEQAGMQFSYIRPADGLLAFVTAGATGPAYDYLGIDVVFDTEALDTAIKIFGDRAFRVGATAKSKGRLSRPLFDAEMIAINRLKERKARLVRHRAKIVQAMVRLTREDSESYEIIVGRPNTAAAIQSRINMVEKAMRDASA